MTDMIRAPWTPEQVAALNAFQQRGGMHPFTCGGDHTPGSPPLIAYTDGWRCPQPYGEACDYQQGWAHGFMADLEAWPKSPFGERHGPTPDEMRRATLIDTEVRAQLHAVIKALGVAETENKTLRAKITEIDHIINWHTTCASCARILDSAYAETVRAEKAEAAVKRVRNLAARIRQGVPWTANDDDIAAHILRALDGPNNPERTTANNPATSDGTPPTHAGGNAENCPVCRPEIDKTVLYPWVCTEPDAAGDEDNDLTGVWTPDPPIRCLNLSQPKEPPCTAESSPQKSPAPSPPDTTPTA